MQVQKVQQSVHSNGLSVEAHATEAQVSRLESTGFDCGTLTGQVISFQGRRSRHYHQSGI